MEVETVKQKDFTPEGEEKKLGEYVEMVVIGIAGIVLYVFKASVIKFFHGIKNKERSVLKENKPIGKEW
jgi:hypothetical protein